MFPFEDNLSRQHFKELKKSEETYVFNRNDNGDNSFTTDGDKLYINYSMADDGKSKAAGQTIFSNLRHETTHAYQFEYGELGFENIGIGKWNAINYDIMDEYEAHTNQNFGFRWRTVVGSSRERWTRNTTTFDEKIEALCKKYQNIPSESCFNINPEKNKNSEYYVLPYKKRNTIGKSFGYRISLFEHELPIFDWLNLDIKRNDTIFELRIYPYNDSIMYLDTNINIGLGWWLSLSYLNKGIKISKFNKTKKSSYYKMFNGILFMSDCEVQMTRMKVYNENSLMCSYYFKMGHLSYASGEIKQPKRKIRKRIFRKYLKYKATEN